MERKLTYFWEETKYEQSSTRLMSLLVFFAWVRFNELYFATPTAHISDYWLVLIELIYMIAIFTPKYLHKIAELKFKPTETTNP